MALDLASTLHQIGLPSDVIGWHQVSRQVSPAATLRRRQSYPRECMGGFCTTSLRWDGSRIWCGHFSWIQLDALVAREKCEACCCMQLSTPRVAIWLVAKHTLPILSTIRGDGAHSGGTSSLDRQ